MSESFTISITASGSVTFVTLHRNPSAPFTNGHVMIHSEPSADLPTLISSLFGEASWLFFTVEENDSSSKPSCAHEANSNAVDRIISPKILLFFFID